MINIMFEADDVVLKFPKQLVSSMLFSQTLPGIIPFALRNY